MENLAENCKIRAGDIPCTKTRKLKLLQTVQVFEHASTCQSSNCSTAGCDEMKYTIIHFSMCTNVRRHECLTCQQFLALCKCHAKRSRNCETELCSIPFCAKIKHMIEMKNMLNVADELAIHRHAQPAPSVNVPRRDSNPILLVPRQPLQEYQVFSCFLQPNNHSMPHYPEFYL